MKFTSKQIIEMLRRLPRLDCYGRYDYWDGAHLELESSRYGEYVSWDDIQYLIDSLERAK